jgi:gliding motility-associated-like protein
VCGDKPVVLKATVAGSSYRWNTGSTDSVLTVTRSGHYVVNIANSCGSTSDSVYVTFEPLPEIELGRDTTLCVGQILRLSAQHPLGQSYRWQNGYDAAALEVTEPGLYRVEVAGKTCGFSDSIRVAFVECEDQLIIPNVFTPNGDGYNERFEVRGIRPGNWALQVSNRYGKLVFESRAYYNEWRGEDLPAGVYYYYLKDPASLRSYRGWVQLLR